MRKQILKLHGDAKQNKVQLPLPVTCVLFKKVLMQAARDTCLFRYLRECTVIGLDS